ncbi:MAG: sigma-70 family RNA polymerase sigma factor [Phycisphaerae bacterium]|nr:sigma-70 family RNA polymerase sigma factor [Phycisphaerae bacterium]
MAEDALRCDLQATHDILDEDRILVAAARQDTEAAGRLFDKYYSEVLSYIHHCTFDSAVTEDLTSNVFLAAFRHLGRYRWRQIPFRAWLFRIATNEVRMHWRRQRRVKMISLEPDADIHVAGPSDADSLEAAEEYRLVHKALLELRSKYRTVIVLRYFEDKAIAEICEITATKEGTVKSQLHRGLARLQDILVRWGVLPE